MIYKGDITDAISDVKRLYVDGLVIEKQCPNCGKTVEKNFSIEYISYGLDSHALDFYCMDGCEHEWSIPATIAAEITIATNE